MRISSTTYEKLSYHLRKDSPIESAAFLLAGFFTNSEGSHFVVKDLLMPQDSDYDYRGEYHIQVSPLFVNKVITKAENENLAVVSCHSHPWTDELSYSRSDDAGEKASAKTFFDCLLGKPMGSLLFGTSKVIGRIWSDPIKRPNPVDQIRIVGRHLRFQSTSTAKKNQQSASSAVYSRQILAFGKEGQELISTLTIGIVGLGATGSCIAEQLARLGATRFLLVDKDKFDPSNLTRVYGSHDTTRQEKKTEIARKNILKINQAAKVEPIYESVLNQRVLKKLKDCDVVFSCTDLHTPRSVLNELCYQYFIPVIDVGAGLDSDGGKITGGAIRSTLIAPELPCLFCFGIVRPDVIAAELMSPEDRKVRLQEGYIPNVDFVAPSVISFTTMTAGMGVSMFLDLLFNFMNTTSSNFLLDIVNFETYRLSAKIDSICTNRLGRGDYMPLSAP